MSTTSKAKNVTLKKVTLQPVAAKPAKSLLPKSLPKASEKPDSKKEEVTKEVTTQNKNKLIEKVISQREVKYIYPEDITDVLARKAFRQKVRNKLEDLELTMLKIKDQGSKEYTQAKKAYETYYKSVMKEVC